MSSQFSCMFRLIVNVIVKAKIPQTDNKKFFQSFGEDEEAAVVSRVNDIGCSHDVM